MALLSFAPCWHCLHAISTRDEHRHMCRFVTKYYLFDSIRSLMPPSCAMFSMTFTVTTRTVLYWPQVHLAPSTTTRPQFPGYVRAPCLLQAVELTALTNCSYGIIRGRLCGAHSISYMKDIFQPVRLLNLSPPDAIRVMPIPRWSFTLFENAVRIFRQYQLKRHFFCDCCIRRHPLSCSTE